MTRKFFTPTYKLIDAVKAHARSRGAGKDWAAVKSWSDHYLGWVITLGGAANETEAIDVISRHLRDGLSPSNCSVPTP